MCCAVHKAPIFGGDIASVSICFATVVCTLTAMHCAQCLDGAYWVLVLRRSLVLDSMLYFLKKRAAGVRREIYLV